jgi:hypothetical protein
LHPDAAGGIAAASFIMMRGITCHESRCVIVATFPLRVALFLEDSSLCGITGITCHDVSSLLIAVRRVVEPPPLISGPSLLLFCL